ncbi:MAG: DNA-binding protein [Saccharofermentanales bacterium]
MHKKLTIIIAAMLFAFAFNITIFASEITSVNYLIENAKALDGTEVLIQGETIGEPMQRGNYCWINVKDNTNAIGIWIKNEVKSDIIYYGNYKITGDTVKIAGVFNKACIEHGGEPDIHCEKLQIEKIGSINNISVSNKRVILAIGLLIIMLISGFSVYYFILLKKSTFFHSIKNK